MITDVNQGRQLQWLTGYFTKYTTADNVPDALGNTGTAAPDFGVQVIGLTS